MKNNKSVSTAVTRYFQKVDNALAGATYDQQVALIETEIRKWESRFQEFQSLTDSGAPLPDWCIGATAFDFHETLFGLEKRRPHKEAA